jgi:hypothetical protein
VKVIKQRYESMIKEEKNFELFFHAVFIAPIPLLLKCRCTWWDGRVEPRLAAFRQGCENYSRRHRVFLRTSTFFTTKQNPRSRHPTRLLTSHRWSPLQKRARDSILKMASHQLAIAKASFSAGLLRPDPTSVSREDIAHFHSLLNSAVIQCTPRNVQV